MSIVYFLGHPVINWEQYLKPVELAYGYYLRLANVDESYVIARKMKHYTTFLEGFKMEERRVKGHGKVQGGRRYLLVDNYLDTIPNKNLEFALRLSNKSLVLPFYMYSDEPGTVENLDVSAYHYRQAPTPITLDETDYDNIRLIYKYVDEYREGISVDAHQYGYIETALEDFLNLDMIHERFSLRIMMILTTLENLLTSRSNMTDDRKAIQHQVAAKLSIINLLMKKKIHSPMDEISIKETMLKCFELRSDITEGVEDPIRDNPNLQALVSREKSLAFLIASIKLVLIFALKQPEALSELREC